MGRERNGKAGPDRIGLNRIGTERTGRIGLERKGKAWTGQDRNGRNGWDRKGLDWTEKERQERSGQVWTVVARRGVVGNGLAGLDRTGQVLIGQEWQD